MAGGWNPRSGPDDGYGRGYPGRRSQETPHAEDLLPPAARPGPGRLHGQEQRGLRHQRWRGPGRRGHGRRGDRRRGRRRGQHRWWGRRRGHHRRRGRRRGRHGWRHGRHRTAAERAARGGPGDHRGPAEPQDGGGRLRGVGGDPQPGQRGRGPLRPRHHRRRHGSARGQPPRRRPRGGPRRARALDGHRGQRRRARRLLLERGHHTGQRGRRAAALLRQGGLRPDRLGQRPELPRSGRGQHEPLARGLRRGEQRHGGELVRGQRDLRGGRPRQPGGDEPGLSGGHGRLGRWRQRHRGGGHPARGRAGDHGDHAEPRGRLRQQRRVVRGLQCLGPGSGPDGPRRLRRGLGELHRPRLPFRRRGGVPGLRAERGQQQQRRGRGGLRLRQLLAGQLR